MKRFLLTALGASMIIVSAYLAIEKKTGTVLASLPLLVALTAIVIMSILPKKEPKPLKRIVKEAWTNLSRLSGLRLIDLELSVWGMMIAIGAIILFPKGLIVFLFCIAIIGISLLLVMLILGKK